MSCPETPLPQTCGLEAAKFLVEGGHILLEPYLETDRVKMSEAAMSIMEVLKLQNVTGSGLYDVARFACIACGKCVEIIDDDADMSFRLVDAGARS